MVSGCDYKHNKLICVWCAVVVAHSFEITIGHIRKTYRNAQITYHDGRWLFPLSQKETFGYWPKSVKAQIRIVWANGVVEGKPINGLRMIESTSKEVL